jgi:ATP-dependent DNA ligase
MKKSIEGVFDWFHNQKVCGWKPGDAKTRRFEAVRFLLERDHPPTGPGPVRAVPQEQLPFSTPRATEIVNARLEEVVAAGGEGLILRNLNSVWEPQRSWNVLKVKPFQDAEVRVRGYVWGRETDKGSKLLGLMGALVCDFKGKRLEISGFTDDERRMRMFDPEGSFSTVELEGFARTAGEQNPGREVDVNLFFNPKFPVGSTVTIRYRELTAAGVPKEAKYWRHRPEGA